MNRISLIGFTIVVVGAMLFSQITSAQSTGDVQVPGSEVGRRVANYIQAFNAGEDAMRAFLSSNGSTVGLERRLSETVSGESIESDKNLSRTNRRSRPEFSFGVAVFDNARMRHAFQTGVSELWFAC